MFTPWTSETCARKCIYVESLVLFLKPCKIYGFQIIAVSFQSLSQDAMVRMLEEERDHYKRELDIMKALRTHGGSLRNAGTVSTH